MVLSPGHLRTPGAGGRADQRASAPTREPEMASLSAPQRAPPWDRMDGSPGPGGWEGVWAEKPNPDAFTADKGKGLQRGSASSHSCSGWRLPAQSGDIWVSSLQRQEGPKGGSGLHACRLGTEAHSLNPAFSWFEVTHTQRWPRNRAGVRRSRKQRPPPHPRLSNPRHPRHHHPPGKAA